MGASKKIKTALLLSGGMDSIALAYWKKPDYSITINYGQKAVKAEIEAARSISEALGIEHIVINVDCSELGSGDMSDNQSLSISPVSEWWPYRNQLLVTLACMKCVGLGVEELYVGSVNTDSSHKDGTKDFYSLLNDLVSYQEGNISIKYPLVNTTTVDFIKKINLPKSILLWAHSCHTSNEPCMHCNGCKKYLYVLQELGID